MVLPVQKLEILNSKGLKNHIIGSKVTTILLNGWILTIGGVASGMVSAQPAKHVCFSCHGKKVLVFVTEIALYHTQLCSMSVT